MIEVSRWSLREVDGEEFPTYDKMETAAKGE